MQKFYAMFVIRRTYYNEYCIKKEECHAQRPIVANCEGKCGSCKS